jgi:hypothetical protein
MTWKLPHNRAEQFYTGAIFPSLVGADNFRSFDKFVALLGGFEVPPLRTGEDCNFQFFTEYSLRKALVKADQSRFEDAPTTGETPDIVMVINGVSRRVMSIIEGKMYSPATSSDLRTQMTKQAELMGYMAQKLKIDAIWHGALLAKTHAASMHQLGFPVLTWEQIVDVYEPIVGGDHYFLGELKSALKRFDHMVGASGAGDGYGKNAEDHLTGAEILRQFKSDTLEFGVMGRNLGLHGKWLNADLATGTWKTQRYEVNTAETPPNRNWFSVAEFVARLREANQLEE